MLRCIYGLEKTSGMKYNIYNYADKMYMNRIRAPFHQQHKRLNGIDGANGLKQFDFWSKEV